MSIILNTIAAFGAGVLAAAVGSVNAFIMTGFIAIIGGTLMCLGVPLAGDLNGIVAFGTIWGPHVSFAAGAAATAYAAKIKKIESGTALGQGLAFLNEPSVLAVGGLFGVSGWIIGTYVVPAVFGGLIPVGTDNPGMTVFFSGVIARLAFGTKGLWSPERTFIAKGKEMSALLLRAFGLSVMVGGSALAINGLGVSLAGYNILIFGCAAITLIFSGVQSWHHIGIISAYGAMIAVNAGMGDLGVMALTLFGGIGAALLCNIENHMMNTGVESHIDGEGFAICLMTIVMNLISMAL